jgi:hypothetical protein
MVERISATSTPTPHPRDGGTPVCCGTRSLAEVGAERGGVPFLRPEIVLLYKAGELSPKNEADFAAVRPQLTQTATQWLREALEVIILGIPGFPVSSRVSHLAPSSCVRQCSRMSLEPRARHDGDGA